MTSEFPTENTIRKYLLGRLANQGELEKSLNQQIFFDSELSEIVDSIEDEIIEDYLDGALDGADRKMVEEYFLLPAQRKEKLQFARFLRRKLVTNPGALTSNVLDVPRAPEPKLIKGASAGASTLPWRAHFRTYCEIGTLVLLTAIVLVYVSRVRHELESKLEAVRNSHSHVEGELAQERERSASLSRQLQESQPPVTILAFLGPVFRDTAETPVVEIRPWTQRIKVEIDLQGLKAADYDVRLETSARRTLWSQAKLSATKGGLRFEMPAQGISAGRYCLVVNSRPESYCFRTKVIR